MRVSEVKIDVFAKQLARAMMRLRRKNFDASKCKSALKAFSEWVATLVVGAKRMVRQRAQVARTFMHHVMLPSLCAEALTSGSSESTNAPLCGPLT